MLRFIQLGSRDFLTEPSDSLFFIRDMLIIIILETFECENEYNKKKRLPGRKGGVNINGYAVK